MQKTIIALSSITYAIKAKNLLNSYGFNCEIVRTPKNLGSGCGYSIRTTNDPNDILAYLKSSGIKWKDYVTI
ncbi:MAG: DUF3343 domain-containing protein [Clostridiales bacterium]|nr:DUF3343 domain-containing protein [Clostridiales bacterium]